LSNSNPLFFRSNLDTFSGNSGAPVINIETGVVEGVLVRGSEDYKFDITYECFRPKVCVNCVGEDVTRSNIMTDVHQILSSLNL
jgi:hypothetical protein